MRKQGPRKRSERAEPSAKTPILISVITPSFNSAATIERTIRSVLAQDYPHYEHVIVDGGSTDGTLDILRRYPGLRWVSEPDKGQPDAMNKGFRMARGEAVVYVNTDDYFLEGAFSAVAPLLQAGAKMVMGKVKVLQENNQTEWINDPRTDLDSMLRHWEPDAFCVNSVGYFYRREVQEAVPFNLENDDKMDLEFLIEVARRFRIEKVDRVLGVFNYAAKCKTGREQVRPDYWRASDFPFIDRVLVSMPPDYQASFRRRQQVGYQLRRYYTIEGAKRTGAFEALSRLWKLIRLPDDRQSPDPSLVARATRYVADQDSIIIALSHESSVDHAVTLSISRHAPEGQSLPVYHLSTFRPKALESAITRDGPLAPDVVSAAALRHIYDSCGKRLKWKFIAAVHDPVAFAVSRCHPGDPATAERELHALMDRIEAEVDAAWAYFQTEYDLELGLDCRGDPGLLSQGYRIVQRDNVELLIYKAENLSRCFGEAMQEYLGLSRAELNLSSQASWTSDTRPASLRFPDDFLERIYDGEYCRNFYRAEERASFQRQWREQARTTVRVTGATPTIYDVGMHTGEDTSFYLAKGFSVVAIEAGPTLCEAARREFAEYLRSGQLRILNVGVTDRAGEAVFYVNRSRPEWSSFSAEIAERDGTVAEQIVVPCRRLSDIVKECGEPYYVKIDIEGYDWLALRSLLEDAIQPAYVSVESGNGALLPGLVQMGFTGFQYVQQRDVTDIMLPCPALEGRWVPFKFLPGSSGPFGRELSGEWLDAESIARVISRYWDPKTGGKRPGYDDQRDGWFDLHARRPV
jgi:FkbM family methyltransferase